MGGGKRLPKCPASPKPTPASGRTHECEELNGDMPYALRAIRAVHRTSIEVRSQIGEMSNLRTARPSQTFVDDEPIRNQDGKKFASDGG